MDSSQGLLSDRCHKDDIASLVPEPIAVKSWLAGSTRDPEGGISPQLVDVTAEETCPTDAAQMPIQDEALTPVSLAAKAPSKTTFALMSQLEALAGDLAAKGRDGSSDQPIENVHDDSNFSAGSQVTEPSIHVTPRPTGFESDLFANDRPSIGRRTAVTLAGFLAVALIGVAGTFAWQPHRASSATPSNEADIAAEQPRSAPATQVSTSGAALPQSGPIPQTALAPGATTTSPELLKQLEAMAQDLASVRRGVEQLVAKQEQLAAAQQRLEQLAAKREQTAQTIAKPQPREHNIRQKIPPPPQSRAALIPPRVSPEPAAQLSSAPAPAPRSESHPLPPLPVPP